MRNMNGGRMSPWRARPACPKPSSRTSAPAGAPPRCNKRQLSDDTFARAKQILGEQQVVDLVAVTGFYVMVSAVVIAGRIEIPDGGAPPMPVLVK